MKTKYIVSLGEILMDANTQSGIMTVGGAPSNWAIDCHRLITDENIKTVVVSAVGEDRLGQYIETYLKKNEIGSLLAHVPGKETGFVMVTYKGDEPQYDIIRDVAWDYISFENATPQEKALMEEIRSNCCAVCWGTLGQRSPVPRKFIQEFVASISTPETIKVYDPNIRETPDEENKEIILKSMTLANTVKLGHEEVDIIGELFSIFPAINKKGENKGIKKDYAKRCKILFKRFPNLKTIIITLSHRGSHIFLRDGRTSWQRARKVNNAKTIGCGDSFCAALTSSIELKEAHEKACQVSSFVAQNDSATPIFPDEYKIK